MTTNSQPPTVTSPTKSTAGSVTMASAQSSSPPGPPRRGRRARGRRRCRCGRAPRHPRTPAARSRRPDTALPGSGRPRPCPPPRPAPRRGNPRRPDRRHHKGAHGPSRPRHPSRLAPATSTPPPDPTPASPPPSTTWSTPPAQRRSPSCGADAGHEPSRHLPVPQRNRWNRPLIRGSDEMRALRLGVLGHAQPFASLRIVAAAIGFRGAGRPQPSR